MMQSEDETSRLAGYKLRITGHSLGAGCASILSFLLKSQYPDLLCLCFCPPGCTLSENMADSCKDYLTSYVLDTDIVPRTSPLALQHLSADMLEQIALIKVTKYEATHAKPGNEELSRILYESADDAPPCRFREQLDEFRAYQEEKRNSSSELHAPLYPPGKIVHLFKTREEQPGGCFSCTSISTELPTSNNVYPQYTARWAQRSDLAEIIISLHFVKDHGCDSVLDALEHSAGIFGLSAPFVVNEDDQTEGTGTA